MKNTKDRNGVEIKLGDPVDFFNSAGDYINSGWIVELDEAAGEVGICNRWNKFVPMFTYMVAAKNVEVKAAGFKIGGF